MSACGGPFVTENGAHAKKKGPNEEKKVRTRSEPYKKKSTRVLRIKRRSVREGTKLRANEMARKRRAKVRV